MSDSNNEEEKEKWVNNWYYSSSHQILLVGEGDFSFALSLALSFGSASNILATSLDSYDALTKKYKRAKSNLELLEKLGALLMHGVDATKMKLHPDLMMRKFDRIVYNFPHAGFHGKEENLRLIKKHRGLVHGFFRSASGMLRPDGEVHVTHKTSHPFCNWNLEELASQNSLVLVECAPFNIKDYPGYNNKRGDGSRSDDPFRLGECSTFKFMLSRGCKKSSKHVASHDQLHRTTSCEEKCLNSLRFSQLPPNDDRFREECAWMFDWHFNHVRETFGLPEGRIYDNVQEAVDRGYERFVCIASGRPRSDFIVYLEELHRLSLLRIHWLEQNLEGMGFAAN